MFFVEPPPTQYDLHFNVAGVPVRVHPMFWLVTLVLGASANPQPATVLLWIVAEFVCILVHELGHVAAFRYYGMDAHVVLHAFGGLAIPNAARWGGRGRTQETWLADVVISLAGPFAGFAFAAAIFAGLAAAGRAPELVFDRQMLVSVHWTWFDAYNANILLLYMQFINIFWGIINLLPVYPLDGGQVSRAVLGRIDAMRGLNWSLSLSVFVAAGVAMLCFLHWHQTGVALFFGYMAYQNYQVLQQVSGGGRSGRGW